MPAHLAEDAPRGVACAGINDHVPHQIDVDRERWKAAQQIQAVNQAFHDERANLPLESHGLAEDIGDGPW